MTYQPPVRDYAFLLRDVLQLERYANLPAFADASMETVDQILEEAGRFTGEVLAPLNSVGDKEGCRWSPDFSVTTPKGFKEAYRQLVDGGWPALGVDPAYGGQGLPHVVNLAFSEMSSAANMAFSMYPGLTHGAYSAILAGGSQEQKDLYLPKLASFQWGGTMNLTEPQCGTDLGLLRTKAVPQADGSYKLSGQKIWISGGEQDLTENIVHLVLARIEGAPMGTRGISLFIVPKFIPDTDGNPGERNSVKCLGLEEKMGIHGNATCVISHEEATGWLIGEENRGLSIMFVMMNEARLGVGMQGIAQAEAAYQAAAAFAKDRLQGRSLTGPKNADGPADPIIVHPDVRRMLMDAKAIVEGGRAFLFWTALHGDLAEASPDEAVRQKGHDYMALMTPVLKGFLTDRGFQVCSDAMQVHGGSGFTEHFPVSQYLRDCRIALIYEGTNGIQALDLVGRKLAADGGRGVMSFFAELDAFIEANEADETLKPFTEGLAKGKAELQEATMWLMQNGLANPDNAGAASTDYMHLFGLTALAYMWALMAKTAQEKIAGGSTDPVYAEKLAVGRYYIARVLPETAGRLAKLKTGAETLMALPAESSEETLSMATYRATSDWSLKDGEDFATGRYSRGHSVTFGSGYQAPGTASPHVVGNKWSVAGAVDPEEMLVGAINTCHMLSFLHVAREAGFTVTRYRDEAVGVMEKNATGELWVSKVTLRPQITYSGPQPAAEQRDHMHHKAHEICFIANSVKTEIVVEEKVGA